MSIEKLHASSAASTRSNHGKFNTYMAGCTTTSTTGAISNVCYIPAGYYVVFMVYFRYSRKDIFQGNVGMALLR